MNNNNNNELELMRERYLKLVDMHGKLQLQNSLLEERILSIVETYSTEKSQLEQALSDAKERIGYLQETVHELQTEKQRYKDDCNLAVRLLHRYPNEFISTTSGQIPEQLKNRYESTSIANQPITSQRSVSIPTFPPTFVSLPSLLTTTSSPVNPQPTPNVTTTADNLRLTAQALFKSNSVHRSPSTQFQCSDCHRIVKRCDVSVQTSLDEKTNPNTTSRIRLVSLTSSDDGLTGDGTWLSLDSPHARMATQEYPIGHTRQALHDHEVSSRSIPRMHHV
jgi:hypothetical protein